MESMAKGVILGEPDADCFFGAVFDKPQSLFSREDEETGFVVAAGTRIGSESTRVAFVTQKELSEALENPRDLPLAREILMRSVSIRTVNMGPPPEIGRAGEGLLYGCFLLPVDSEGAAVWNTYKLTDSDELGVLIERM